MELSLYLAGPLFNVAERKHNAELESVLISESEKRGINLKVTMPQRKAKERFIFSEERFDIKGIVADCIYDSIGSDVALFNLDGSDVDGGTAVEYGIVLGQKLAKERIDQGIKNQKETDYSANFPRIITYRTDFRTSPEKELGVNAMLKAENTHHIYFPCFEIELGDFSKFYENLGRKIFDKIIEVV